MAEKTLAERIESATNEAKTLAEYWTGTPHEAIIIQQLNELLDKLPSYGRETIEGLLQTLENTLVQARGQIEKAENEG